MVLKVANLEEYLKELVPNGFKGTVLEGAKFLVRDYDCNHLGRFDYESDYDQSDLEYIPDGDEISDLVFDYMSKENIWVIYEEV